MNRPPASWVIRRLSDGASILETFSRRTAEAVNTAKYEAVPILQHLHEFNAAVRAAGGVQPPPGRNRR